MGPVTVQYSIRICRRCYTIKIKGFPMVQVYFRTRHSPEYYCYFVII
jgi:hypothetical protein